jgi:hypothetical protein
MDKRKTLPHHGARHGTVEMVDASDEDGSSLSFNSSGAVVLMVKFRQPSHEFTFGVGISFIPYPLVLTPLV